MYLGQIVDVGPADAVFEAPHHPYTEALLSAIPTLEPDAKARMKLHGTLPSPADPPTGCRFHTRCPRFLGRGVHDGRAAVAVDLGRRALPVSHRAGRAGPPSDGRRRDGSGRPCPTVMSVHNMHGVCTLCMPSTMIEPVEPAVSGCQAVERAITILELFDETPDGARDRRRGSRARRAPQHRLAADGDPRAPAACSSSTTPPAATGSGWASCTLAGHVLNRFPVRALRRAGCCASCATRPARPPGSASSTGTASPISTRPSSPHVTVNVDWVGVRQELTEGVTGRLLLAYQPRRRDRPARGRGAAGGARALRDGARGGAPPRAMPFGSATPRTATPAWPCRSATRRASSSRRSRSAARGSASTSERLRERAPARRRSRPPRASPRRWDTAPPDAARSGRGFYAVAAPVGHGVRRAGRRRSDARGGAAPARFARRPAACLGHGRRRVRRARRRPAGPARRERAQRARGVDGS